MANGHKFKLIPVQSDTDDEVEEYTVFVSDSLKGKTSPDHSKQTRRRNRIFCIAIFGILLLITLVSLIYSVHLFRPTTTTHNNSTHNDGSSHSDDMSPSNKTNNGWKHSMQPAFTSLSMVELDINNDGIPDLVFDAATERLELQKYLVCPNEENSCMEDFGFTPCRVRLVALDGRNGSLIWEKWIEFTPFAANCKHDLNLDGVLDCTFSGRQGSFAVLNPVDGSFLWYIDPAVTFPPYNYYYPLFIRDFDEDGVTDIIVTHGGDTLYDDNVKNRSPGFIFVVSGKTGQQLSDRIVMPDGHETYSTPIGYNISGTIEVVLFGSGGETIGGSLWAITVESLQENVDTWAHNKPIKYDINYNYVDVQCSTDEEIGQMRPKFVKDTFKYVEDKDDWLLKCPVWNTDTQSLWNPYKLCVYEIITAGKTGTIIPPVIIDYNNDGIKDLLVSQFNDHVMMIDGATTKITWDHYAEDTQSYSIPSPLYFNDDDIPDFLFRFNKGKWMNYDYSYVGIVDGNNGELMWSMNCSLGAMGSAITIKSSKKGQDGLLFLASGCEEKSKVKKKEVQDFKVYKKRQDNTCPSFHWGIEQFSVCFLENRNKRHGDDGDDDTMSGGDDTSDQFHSADDFQKPEVLRPNGIDFSKYMDDIPTDIWKATDDTDTFPDPWSDTRSFVQDYCNIPYDRLVNQVYFITPNMIKLGKIEPIIENKPYVYRPLNHSNFEKRHGHAVEAESSIETVLKNRMNIRCAHILLPLMIVTTPRIGDFNVDGKLDAALSITFDSFPNELYNLKIFHPSEILIDVFTFEDKLKEIFGPDIGEVVDFASYYPANKQPWGQYMGSRGNGVYETPSS